MRNGRHVVLACDESGAKGYADQDEAQVGEVGVFAGILIPQQEREAEARPEFQAIYNRYKPATGKLHIAHLTPKQQETLRQDVYDAVRKWHLPCFWYAIHVAGLHDWHKVYAKLIDDARKAAEALPKGSSDIRRGSPREQPASLHVELFDGLYAHLVAFLAERDCVETVVEIRTDQVDSPIVAQFEHVARRLLSQDPLLSKVKGYNMVTKTPVEGTIEIRIDYPPEMQFASVVKGLTINTTGDGDGYVLAADVLANSLNHLFMHRDASELYGPLNRQEAIAKHPLADCLSSFGDWGTGDLLGDRLYSPTQQAGLETSPSSTVHTQQAGSLTRGPICLGTVGRVR
jgi:hypothetical protein